jgi:hypothetical protein
MRFSTLVLSEAKPALIDVNESKFFCMVNTKLCSLSVSLRVLSAVIYAENDAENHTKFSESKLH